MTFDPKKVPFSYRESFLCLSWLEDGLWLRNLRGGDEHTDLGRMLRVQVLQDGQVFDAHWTLTPDTLRAVTPRGEVGFAFDGPNRVVVAGNLGLRLSSGSSKYDYAQEADDHVHICIARQDLRCEIRVQTGAKVLRADWNGLSADNISVDLLPDGDTLAAVFDLFRVTRDDRPLSPFPAVAARAAQAFAAFKATLPACLPDHKAGHNLAAYILWSGYVAAEGALTRPAIYMSKNWMTNIWSWDHCFVALALPPDLAWQQMEVIFAAQDPTGRLPDYINDRYAYWAFTKPPVHGWTFGQLQTPPQHRAQIAHWLTLQTEAWLTGPSWRGLPAYRHGNDAGWDNASPFAEGAPVATPDLATFLILQLDEIARLQMALGAPELATQATARADDLCQTLCRELWTGEGFISRRMDGQAVTSGHSLLLFLPLLLGSRFSLTMRDKLMENFKKSGFLTRHGLATEAPDSPLYRANGYWRGPIWAPTTLLFVDALDRCGQSELGDEIARRYVAMCQTSGMAENHDALTGEGLHDPAFAWTSAVYLILANRLYRLAKITSR